MTTLLGGPEARTAMSEWRLRSASASFPLLADYPSVKLTSEVIRAFENSFFGINNLEATSMDPKQRKLLEAVFECFESARVPLDKVSGSNTGCYMGNFTIDYQVMQTRDPEYSSRNSAIGMGTTILFNLLGPR